MKRIIIGLGILAVFLAPCVGFAASPITYTMGSGNTPADLAACTYGSTTNHLCTPRYNGTPGVPVLMSENGGEYGLGDAVLDAFLGLVKNALWGFTNMIFWFAGISALLLDAVIQISIINMGALIGKCPPDAVNCAGAAIAQGWTIFRDLANLAFIGGLIWASFSMILGTGTKAGSLVSKIIITALLVNFSYFFAGAIIDASNALTITIYNAGVQGSQDANLSKEYIGVPLLNTVVNSKIPFTGGNVVDSGWKVKYSEILLSRTKLISIWDKDAMVQRIKDGGDNWGIILTLLSAIFLFLITGMAFFMAAFLLLGRFVILVLLLITAPLGILHFSGLPLLDKWGGQWWKSLIHQSVFPPVFMLLSMISFNIMGALQNNPYLMPDNKSSPGAVLGDLASLDFKETSNAMGLLITYFLAMGFMYAALIISKSIATESETKMLTSADVQSWFVKRGENWGKKGNPLALGKLAGGFLLKGGSWAGKRAGGGLWRAAGGPELGRQIGKGIGNLGIVRAVTGKTKAEVEREKREEKHADEDLEQAEKDYASWKARVKAAQAILDAKDEDLSDDPAEAARMKAQAARDLDIANRNAGAAKEKVEKGWVAYHKTHGPAKTAQRIDGLTKIDPKTRKEVTDVDAQDRAIHALGEDGPAVDRLRKGGGTPQPKKKKEGGTESGGAGSSAATTAAIQSLKPEFRRLIEGQGNLTRQLMYGFNELEVEQKRAIIYARKDLVTDQKIVRELAGTAGSEDRNQFGKLLVDVATHDPGRLSENHDHLTDYHPDMARNMTSQGYASLRGRYEESSPIMQNIHREMRRNGTGKLIEEYGINPGSRVD